MSFLNNICDKDWKIYGLVFVSCFVLIGLSNYFLFQPHMRFKGKAKKLNVTYTTIAKCAVIAAAIATAFAFLANKIPNFISKSDTKESSEDKSYKSDDEEEDRRRRRRRREEYRRDERRDDQARESENRDYDRD